MGGRDLELVDLPLPLDLDLLVPGGPWEVEIGFGKGRYLLARAANEPARRFLGIEVARQYWRLMVARARRQGLANLVAVRGEAEQVLDAVLPSGFARAVHVYFPDPWPKVRHQRRRLFDPESVDLVLALLVPGGRLFFATDFLGYGEEVERLLATHPDVEVARRSAWPGGPRTNYESKYEAEGRQILRLEARLAAPGVGLHPAGRRGVVCGYRASGSEVAA